MDSSNKDVLVCASEYIKDRLYFVTLKTAVKPKSTPNTHYFCIDDELVYENFYADFGPLNICMLYHYCMKLNKKLKAFTLAKKKIVHFTTIDIHKRLNAAFLIASYSIIYLNKTPEEAYRPLCGANNPALTMFRDASYGISLYQISLMDCLNAIYKACLANFFDFNDFNAIEYEHYERVENGDLNWILPKKFIAFCGPHSRSKVENGYTLHSPESYFAYFRRYNVTTIIRLNKKIYDATRFTNAGFEHRDLFFIDGSTPSDAILKQFIQICEATTGVVAVHCKAGLGRTGSLIGCYIMKHYSFTARETIAWLRLCRPGCIIGHQQQWLEDKQPLMWAEGEAYRRRNKISIPLKFKYGVYSLASQNYDDCDINEGNISKRSNKSDHVSRILQKVDTMQLNDHVDDNRNKERTPLSNQLIEDAVNLNCVSNNANNFSPLTQGDKLNQIKAMRRHSRSVIMSGLHNEESRLHTRAKSQPFKSVSGPSHVSQSPLKSARVVCTSSNHIGAEQPPPGAVKRAGRIAPSVAKRNAWHGSLCSSSLSSPYPPPGGTVLRGALGKTGSQLTGPSPSNVSLSLRTADRVSTSRFHNTRQHAQIQDQARNHDESLLSHTYKKQNISGNVTCPPQDCSKTRIDRSLRSKICNEAATLQSSGFKSCTSVKCVDKKVIVNLVRRSKRCSVTSPSMSTKEIANVLKVGVVRLPSSANCISPKPGIIKQGDKRCKRANINATNDKPQSAKIIRRTSSQNHTEELIRKTKSSKKRVYTTTKLIVSQD